MEPNYNYKIVNELNKKKEHHQSSVITEQQPEVIEKQLLNNLNQSVQ